MEPNTEDCYKSGNVSAPNMGLLCTRAKQNGHAGRYNGGK